MGETLEIEAGPSVQQEVDSSHPREEDVLPIVFSPPLYRQRYMKALEILEAERIESVVDFGCAECHLMALLKTVASIKEGYGVDIDASLIEHYQGRIRPATYDYLDKRPQPLVLRLYHGSVAEYDRCLEGVQAVIMLEMIEHLEQPVLEAMPPVVFGLLQPKLVYITTPNADFNQLFPDFSGFRHPDHKFEWTRAEFQAWCELIASKYGYQVEYGGLGNPPDGKESHGHCSQSALFKRLNSPRNNPENCTNQTSPYTLISECEYPCIDKSVSDNDRLLVEIGYYLQMLALHDLEEDEEWDGETTSVSVALSRLMSFRKIHSSCQDEEQLQSLLQEGGYTLSGDGTAVLYSVKGEESEKEESHDADSDYDAVEPDAQQVVPDEESLSSAMLPISSNQSVQVPIMLSRQMEEDWDAPEPVDSRFLDDESEVKVIPKLNTVCWAFPPRDSDSEATMLNIFTPALEAACTSFAGHAMRYRLRNEKWLEEHQFSDVADEDS